MDTTQVHALAKVAHSKARSLYREAESLRRLTAALVDATQPDTPSTEDTDGREPERDAGAADAELARRPATVA